MKNSHPVGIHISERMIRIAQIRDGKLAYYQAIPVPPSAVREGEILDPSAIGEALSAAAKLKNVPAAVSIPDGGAYIRFFDFVPGLSDAEIRKRISAEIRRRDRIDPARLSWDFQRVREGKKERVLYIGTPKKFLEAYHSAILSAGFELDAFEIESLSIARAVAPADDGPFIILDCGLHETHASAFSSDCKMQLHAPFPLAVEHLVRAVARKLRLDARTAEDTLFAFGLDREKKANRVLPVVEEKLAPLIAHVGKIAAFYKKKFGENIGTVYLAGPAAMLPGFETAIESELGLSVAFARPAGIRMTDIPSIEEPLLAAVVGLASRSRKEEYDSVPLEAAAASPEEEKRSQIASVFAPKPEAMPAGGIIDEPAPGGTERKPLASASAVRPGMRIILASIFFLLAAVFLGYALYRVSFQPETPRFPRQDAPAVSEPLPGANSNSAPPAPTTTPETVPQPPAPAVQQVKILPTPTGWLNVRTGPSLGSPTSGRIYPGEVHALLAEQNGWYQIETQPGASGWIAARYASKQATP